MSYWKTRLTIGTLSVPRFLGGPLDRFTDAPFRAVTRLFCDQALLYTEIRHVAAVVNMPRERLAIDQTSRPLNFQMTAGSTEYIDQACAIVLAQGVDAIDLNIGCPAPNVVGSGSGSALMADIERLEKILKRFRANVSSPFTVKMRAGFKEHNAETVAQLCQDCGVDALVVHPRLQKQQFKGLPDYSVIASVKKLVSIPVIVSGGINDLATAQSVYNQTGVDGFLIGRAQLGAPWLLRQLQEQSVGNEYQPDQSLVRHAMVEHMKLIEKFYGKKGVTVAKRHIGLYVRCHDGAGAMRKRVHESSCWQDIHEIVTSINQG